MTNIMDNNNTRRREKENIKVKIMKRVFKDDIYNHIESTAFPIYGRNGKIINKDCVDEKYL